MLLACVTSEESSGSNSIRSEDEAPKEQGGDASMEFSNLQFRVKVDVDKTQVTVTMELTNTTENVKRVAFSSGQQFDVLIRDQDGNTVYHYAEGRMFTQAIVMEEIAPGKTLSFKDVWVADQTGEFTVEAMIPLYTLDGNEIERESFLLRVPITIGE